eukprot:gene10686-biopygen22832
MRPRPFLPGGRGQRFVGFEHGDSGVRFRPALGGGMGYSDEEFGCIRTRLQADQLPHTRAVGARHWGGGWGGEVARTAAHKVSRWALLCLVHKHHQGWSGEPKHAFLRQKLRRSARVKRAGLCPVACAEPRHRSPPPGPRLFGWGALAMAGGAGPQWGVVVRLAVQSMTLPLSFGGTGHWRGLFRQFLAWGGAGVARAWRGRGAGTSCSPWGSPQ